MNYLDSFQTFCLFLALKNHFTQESYDFIKYHGKTNATMDAFEKRKDRLQFQKLSRRASDEELSVYIIANLVAGNTWVGQFLDQDADMHFQKYKAAYDNITETVTSEVKQALETCEKDRLFKVDPHEYPAILLNQLDGTVSYLTLVVLNNLIDFVPKYDDAYAGDEVWGSTSLMINKLTPFVIYDKKAMVSSLKPLLL